MLGIDRVLSFEYPRRELAVVGWACLDDHRPAGNLRVQCGDQQFPCLSGIEWPDAARAADASLERAGFLCRFPIVDRGVPVRFVASDDGVDYVVGDLPRELALAADRPELETAAYATWLREHEARLFWPASTVERRLRTLPGPPIVTVILPTYNTELYHLYRCIESVQNQLYPYWELCISDDASPDPRVREYLASRAAEERRIKLTFCEHNGGISAASNRSIEAATGDYMVLLDHDDELHPSALLEVARTVAEHWDVDVIYSDEDKIDQVGVRSWPTFKPAFDEDLLCGFDYFGHLVAIRASVVRKVGGFRSEADGAQDWDLLLRSIASVGRRRVRHIPKPLYHWRMHADSTAFSFDAKPYAVRAWDGVLNHHLASSPSARVTEGLFLGSMRVVRSLPETARVSVLCRAMDGPHQRRALTRARPLRQLTFYEAALCLVFAADRPDSQALMTVEDLESDVTVVVNCGIDSVNHHFLEELAAQAARDDCGIVSGTIAGPDGRAVTAGLMCLSDGTHINPYEGLPLGDPGYMGMARVVREVASIGPQVFAFRTSRLLEAGGLAALAEDSLDALCASLVRSAHAADLKVLHTPYAIATLRTVRMPYVPRQGETTPRRLMINHNLEQFADLGTRLKAGIS